MTMVKTAAIEITGGVTSIDVTFEESLFTDSLKVRKQVEGLGSQNLIAPFNNDANVKLVQASQPLFEDHDGDTDVPAGYIQCSCAAKPTGDMKFHIYVLVK